MDVRVADALRQVSDLELLQVGRGWRAGDGEGGSWQRGDMGSGGGQGTGKEAPGKGGIWEAAETGVVVATRAVDRGRRCGVVARGPITGRCPGS